MNGAHLLPRCAELHGVTLEYLLHTIKLRRRYRNAQKNRRRMRRRILKGHPSASKRLGASFNKTAEPQLYAGEGELHGLLKTLGLSKQEFCRLIDIDPAVFHRWYGHPLHNWPILFLRYFGRAQAMGRYLEALGVDLEQFEPQIPPRLPAPQYPREKPTKQHDPEVKTVYSPWLRK